MYIATNSPVKATRALVVTRALNLLQQWWDDGNRDLQLRYSDVFRAICPGNCMGQVQARFIGEACLFWEEVNGVSISELLPLLKKSQTNGEWHSRFEN